MEKDTKARKYQLTFENPADHGISHDVIKGVLENFKSLIYWCMCDEIGGKTQTYHIHLFMAFNDVVRFSKIKKEFTTAHIEGALKGTCQQNRDYITKSGKWEKDKKNETNLPDTFEEQGIMPFERQGLRNDITEQYDMVKQGMTNYEIMEQFDGNVDLAKIDRMRLTYLSEKYKAEERDIRVIYCFGEPGTGKTSSIFELHGYEKVYKVDEWEHPFDSYECQDVILFDDWRHSLTRITDMLKWLDRFPLKLPCRYAPKQACYTKVYITSNEPLKAVYNTENTTVTEKTRNAFMRRIHEVWIYQDDFTFKRYSRDEYFKKDEFIDIDQYNQEEFPWKIN